MTEPIKSVRLRWWVVLACMFISLVGIVDHDLWTPDEVREGAIALRMARTGDLIVPYLGDQPFVEKPPLYYILGSSMMKRFGSAIGNTGALRLTSAFFGIGALLATWFLGRRLLGPDSAALAALILATMPGFVHVTHWILVDNALLFFVVASVACLVEAYETRRFGFLVLAAILAAAAFLSKGLVGPAVVGLAWTGLAARRLWTGDWRELLRAESVFFHLLGVALFVGLAGAWMLAFREAVSADLWRHWFWSNNFGRFTGSSTDVLGHKQGLFYYLEVLPVYILPWIAVWIAGLVRLAARIRRREAVPPAWWLLLCWGMVGMLLLSLSSTKREIYLVVLLPAFALMTAASLGQSPTGLPRYWLLGWIGILLGILAAMAIAPAVSASFRALVGDWPSVCALAAAALVVSVLVMRHETQPFLSRWFVTTALCFITIMAIVFPVVDRFKSFGPAFAEMGQGIARQPGARIADWNCDETTVGGMYYYGDMTFPKVGDMTMVTAILNGTHPHFNGLLVLSKSPNRPLMDTMLPPSTEAMRVTMGGTRVLQWLTGRNTPSGSGREKKPIPREGI